MKSPLRTSLLLCALAQAAPPASDADAVCAALQAAFPAQVAWDPAGPRGLLSPDAAAGAAAYGAATADYWNAGNAAQRPACVFAPADAAQVARAVRALRARPAARFALKSGGHNANPGFSSVGGGGVLVAFRPRASRVVVARDGGSVVVGAGCKWDDVYAALQPLGKTVVGGRLGDVGVTGFVLGGGLSYLSAQYGLACDNVLRFECVLANGTVVDASPTSHPDLFFALRGGGNQFAVVVSMTLRTHDVGDGGTVWGGIRTYAASHRAALLAAVANFTAAGPDPKAALIPSFTVVGAPGLDLPVGLFFFFYDGREPPAGVFDAFDAVPALTSDTAARSYLDLSCEALDGKFHGLSVRIRENTFPNMPLPAMASFLGRHYDHLARGVAGAALADDLVDIRLFSFAVQPLPRGIARASRRAGGANALGLAPEHGDRVWVEYDLAWASPLCDVKCPELFRDVVEGARRLHEREFAGIAPTNYVAGDLAWVSYNPIFMNDAMADQDVLQSYGDDVYRRLKVIHQRYDPDGFFSTRQGGFSFTT